MSSDRVFNFSAGPAVMPLECLEQVAKDIMNWDGSGMSVIEISHRSEKWLNEQRDTQQRLRKIINAPDDYEILLMTGGASLIFSSLPYNLIGDKKRVDYLCTGTWSDKAYDEAVALAFPGVEVVSVAGKSVKNAVDVVSRDKWNVSSDAAYFYYCDNETIQGIEFESFPDVPAPLVIDMSSNFLSKPIKSWNNVGCIFACAQKNFGCSGFSVVIVRKDLLKRNVQPHCPITLNWSVQAKHECIYNTPPTLSIHFSNLVFKWIEKQGGLECIMKRNRLKAEKLYKAIDESPHFVNKVKPEWRSKMNIPFFRHDGYDKKDAEKDKKFIKFCEERKIFTLSGHSSVGGFRASIYNACPDEAIDALIKAINEWTGA